VSRTFDSLQTRSLSFLGHANVPQQVRSMPCGRGQALPESSNVQRLCAWLAVSACLSSLSVSLATPLQREPFRPYYHFTPERNWMNDPNGLVFYQGEYHLFYQFNPFGDKWGHMSWGHALSHDLAHWQTLPVALAEEDGILIFSGSAVVDWRNSSGFSPNGNPPLVAIYTGNRTADGRQFQCIAYSNDKGRTWSKFAGNPVLDIGSTDFRDPKVFWYEPAQRWVMVVSLAAARKIRFYASTDFKMWNQLSEFGPSGSTNGVWECPDMFPLPVDNHAELSRWVLIVNVGAGSIAGGSGTQYFIGTFDGTTFKPDSAEKAINGPLWADYGRDFYAGVSWSDIPKADGRRIWLGWMSNWEYAQDVPTAPWRSAMTIPRELRLRELNGALRLVQEPARELQTLRSHHQVFRNGTVIQANTWLSKRGISGNHLEIILELETAKRGACGLKVLKGVAQETVLGFDPARQRLFFDRTHSGDISFHKAFASVQEAPLEVSGGYIHLHVFVDACSVELLANEGQRVFTNLVFPSDSAHQVECFGPDTGAMVRKFEVWTLASP